MKRPLRRRLSRLLLLAWLCAGSALGALVPTEWRHRQTLVVPAPGLVRVALPEVTFDAATTTQADLRVIDSNGRELALLLDRPTAQPARTVRPAAFDVRLVDGATVITLRPGTTGPLTSVRLETPHPHFLLGARVEVAPTGNDWTVIDDGVPVFREWGAEALALPLGGRSAAAVRITVPARAAAAVPFTGAMLTLAADEPAALVPAAAHLLHRDEYAGETVLTVGLEGRHLPLATLALATPEALFMRRVTVAVRETSGATTEERTIGEGSVYRVALDGAPVRSQLECELGSASAARELLVHIHNGDSPPLAVDGVQLRRRATDLFFLAPAAGTYALLSGNEQAEAPRYDLAALAGDLRHARAIPVEAGPLEDMPAFHPREPPATTPLNEVPLTGAPLDVTPWAHRRPIVISEPGVQELELDSAALAGSQADGSDLRVWRDGNQLPYLRETTALARRLTLSLTSVPDPKRPQLSRWRCVLPQAGLPVLRVVVAASTPLFHREFRLYEKLTTADGGTAERVLATGAWDRRPDPDASDLQAFPLTGRPRTDTLFLETDNGDNPPVILRQAAVDTPVTRLVFKVDRTDGVSLIYGNAAVPAPRYDLGLVAPRLLVAQRRPAAFGPGETAPAPAEPWPAHAGVLFWIALSLVVGVLLFTVARLLPRRTSP